MRKNARSVAAIALNTYREALRNKVLGSLIFAALVIIGASLILGQMSLHEEVRVTTDFAYFGTAFFSTLIAIYSTVTLLHTEIERRTIYTILSKPIPRWHVIFGKYIGVIALLTTTVATLLIISSTLIVVIGGRLHEAWFIGHATILFQLMLVVAIALFFSSFSTPLLAGLLTGLMWIVGNLRSQLDAIIELLKEREIPMASALDFIQELLPNLEALNLSTEITYQSPIPAMYVLHAGWYAATYSLIVLIFSALIFRRRDFA